ncbi:hypothetical protein C481_09837 [Natrialba asiatica DSM 12278]|uniref:Uncharacterized protein n=1 Tax=Natrialba asiatica (strain ATCC 700177 / DSM 12278 / JCM 9576 / FERM P-10747 / NBRC 102637 / 172P1) TaxID=29540 RepID=M0ATZ5_NATA1|nr:hypothetical protein C481_09837 [Natrialba asiatica DSM 12278]
MENEQPSVRDRVETVVANSRLTPTPIGSLLSRVGSRVRTRVRNWTANSRLAALGPSLSRRGSTLRSGVANSRLAAVGATWKGYLESTYCYRWLTTEPEPEVIVIDLRETRAVGPIIRLVDRVVGDLATALETSGVARRGRNLRVAIRARPIRVTSLVVLPAIAASLLASIVAGSGGSISTPVVVGHLLVAGLAAIGTRSRRSLAALLDTRAGQVLVAAFEPPAPPARVNSHQQRQGEHDHQPRTESPPEQREQ